MSVSSVVARRSLALASTMVLASALLAVPMAAAKPAICQVLNVSTQASFATLQAAVDAASAGDTLRVKGTCVGSTTIAKDLAITAKSNPGFGPATLDGDHVGRVLTITGGVTVTIRGLTITNGTADRGGGIGTSLASPGSPNVVTIVDSVISGNTATEGGGISNDQTSLTLVDSIVSGNTAAAAGGGIDNARSDGHLDLNGTTSVSGNQAGTDGGGIYNGHFGWLTVNDASSISDNSAARYGGGMYCGDCGLASLNDSSSIHDNDAFNGGGVYVSGMARIHLYDSSSIHHNTATGHGGGTYLIFGCGADLSGASSITDNTPDNCYPPGTVSGCTN